MNQVIGILTILLLCSCAGVRPRYHTVVSGENLLVIAKQYAVPMVEIERTNRRKLTAGLKSGQKLFIPFEQSPDWDSDDEFGDRSPAAQKASYDMNVASFAWPVRGRVSSRYGFRNIGSRGSSMHEGIDIAAPLGTTVKAARAGHVIYAASKIPGYGKMIIVRHAGGFSTVYAHLSSYSVKKGQFVPRGGVVGKVGKTGRSTGYHLHFEIRSKSAPVNPMVYLDGAGKPGSIRVSSR
jgi:murein DD-endopeptidase MepM/ murein hydrolase activator NlpD